MPDRILPFDPRFIRAETSVLSPEIRGKRAELPSRLGSVEDLIARKTGRQLVPLADPEALEIPTRLRLRRIPPFPGRIHLPDDGSQEVNGTPRSELHLPILICGEATPTDRTVFEDPDDAAMHYWLGGGLRLSTSTNGAMTTKWVELTPTETGYTLTAHIEPSDAGAPPGVVAIPSTVEVKTRCFLQATLPDGQVYSRDFSEITVRGSTWTLKMHITGDTGLLAERDKLYAAMTRSKDSTLVVRRSLKLATPIVGFDLEGAGIPRRRPFPRRIARYQVNEFVIESNPIEFKFDTMLDKNVFDKVIGVGTTELGWNHFTIDWRDDPGVATASTHHYYQDKTDPRSIYFLPDEFRVARRAEPPHDPYLNLTVLNDGALLSLGFVAVPVYNPARVAAAFTALREKNGVPDDFVLMLFHAGDAKLRLRLPKGDAAGLGPGLVDLTATSDVQTHLAVSSNVALALDDFKNVFDALVNDDNDLLSGHVEVVIDADHIKIPVVARANKLVGPMLDVESAVDPTSGQITLTVRNGIELAVAVHSLPLTLVKDKQEVASAVVSITPALPTTLLAGTDPSSEPILIVLAPETSGADLKAQIDFSDCVAVPDAQALLGAILDPSAQAHSTREINVQVLASLLAPPAPSTGAPPPPLVVRIEFEGSTSTLDFIAGIKPADGAVFLAQKFILREPLRNFLLGQLQGVAAGYRYRIRVVTTAGERIGGWQSETLDTFYVFALPEG